MNYWLMKSEPDEYSFADLQTEGRGMWDGVRNYQARNYMRSMKKNDRVLFYHSQTDRAAVGAAKVVREAYPDPTAPKGQEDRWSVVDLAPVKAFARPVTLQELKDDPVFAESPLVKRGNRLSVFPLTKEQFERVVELGKQRSG